ncbi:MAG: hypothetical protein SCG74_00055 [Nitrospiraceae bacterium]|nr:hypothetical protein [Nitrospiraceae bacterium]
MARALIEGVDAEQRASHGFGSTVQGQLICRRCGGLMIDDLGMDLLMNGIGELKFPATRCVQCGEVLDPVILQNRQLRQPSMPNGVLEK